MDGVNVQEIVQKSQATLMRFCRDYKIFIDTCAIMDSNIKAFYLHIREYLLEFNSKIYVPYRVVDELNKNFQVLEKRESVIEALTFLEVLNSDGLLSIIGDDTDENFVDNLFLTKFTGMVMEQKVLLVTQDKRLATDVLNLNRRESVRNVNAICVGRINNYGYLSNFFQKS